MTDPLDFDGLVEVAAAHAWFEYCDSLGWPSRNDSHMVARRELIRAQARAILTAILPHVLAGPREALRSFAAAAPALEKCKDNRPLWAALYSGISQREAHPTVGDIRRARAVLARIDKLTEGM